MSYFTKYRPQTIAELDLDAVRANLGSIFITGKFAQVYLFCGPKGTGKTSSARILAKLVNCEENREKLSEPCNECNSCRRITKGDSLSCLEMDAASNRGIDNIRELRERIGLAPAEGRYTVYIIDEVHMLTTEAFNALLKTLEEPPKHAIFILCTTDPQKIPDTVLSRCMRINFTKGTTAEIVKSLSKAVKGEKLEIEAAALTALAERVDGSFRDGMKLLEQLSHKSNKIDLSMVDEVTGFGAGYQVDNLLKALESKDIQLALKELKTKEEQGVEAYLLGKRLLEKTRKKLIDEMANGQVINNLLKLTKLIDETVKQLRLSAIPYLPLEVMVGEVCLGNRIENKEYRIENEEEPKKEDRKIVVELPVKKLDAYGGTLEDITKRWTEILAAVKPLNHSLEALLRSTKLITYENGWLTVEAFYKFHKEQLEQERYRRKLEEVIAQVFGSTINLQFTIRQAVKVDPNVDNVNGKVEDDALVKAAEEIFGK